VVGRLVFGHAALIGDGRVGSTVHFEDSTEMVRQPVYWVRPHPCLYAGRGRCLNVWRAT
jgi:hypothetical protein